MPIYKSGNIWQAQYTLPIADDDDWTYVYSRSNVVFSTWLPTHKISIHLTNGRTNENHEFTNTISFYVGGAPSGLVYEWVCVCLCVRPKTVCGAAQTTAKRVTKKFTQFAAATDRCPYSGCAGLCSLPE